MRITRKLAAALVFFGTYALVVRPPMLRWGATDEEVNRAYPGADLIPDGERSATMAVTIEAPPSKVWPWLVQMGTDRGGWYSWDRLDNWGRLSAERIHPEWQKISLGDRFAGTPDGGQSWEVAALEPERFLGLRMSLDLRGRPFDPAGPPPSTYTDSTWGFLLEELPGEKTRLIVSGYWALRPHSLKPLVSFLFLEPSHWVMQTRQFANLKRRIENTRNRPPAPRSPTSCNSARPASAS